MRVRLVLKIPGVVEGTLRPAGTAILEGELLKGVGLDRLRLILGGGRVDWELVPEPPEGATFGVADATNRVASRKGRAR